MELWCGTSGYAYKEWKGNFYPADCKAEDFLRYYATAFRAVEINNTFYRMPTEKVLLQWSNQVGGSFQFVLKASQRITHRKRLKECGEDLQYFMRTANVLADRLGPTLFQLPPNLKKDLPRLLDFLSLVPPTWRAAFEFRHPSWFDEETIAALRSHGAALVAAEADSEESDAPATVAPTAAWGYLRLRRESYDDEALGEWVRRVRAQPWERVYVFFKHEDAGAGPALARRFATLFEES